MNTAENELKVFKELDEKENALFLFIISYEPYKKVLFNKLIALCSKEKSIKNTDDMVSLWSQIRLTEPLRCWFKQIILLVNAKLSEEDDLFSEIDKITKDDQYKDWSDGVKNQHKLLIKCRNDFAVTNINLVRSVANKIKIDKQTNIPREDLVQEGYFGLIRAIEKFDQNKGHKFSTYAVWWIKHTCRRFMFDRFALIRTPVHTFEVRKKILLFEKTFESQNNKKPSNLDIQKGTGYSKLTFNTIVNPLQVISASPYNDDDDINPLSNIENEKDDRIELESAQTRLAIRAAIEALSEREQKILRGRFGFNDEEEKSLQDLGEELNLSREGIRLIQNSALKKIKTALEKKETI
jgi:RNA polymerase primary sigma factor